jgi:hypothetical protein
MEPRVRGGRRPSTRHYADGRGSVKSLGSRLAPPVGTRNLALGTRHFVRRSAIVSAVEEVLVKNRVVPITVLALAITAAAGQASQQQPPETKKPVRATSAARTAAAALAAVVVVEAEGLLGTAQVSDKAPAPIRQDMTGFAGQWGGNAQLFWRPPAPVDQPIRNWPNIRLFPHVSTAGTYRVTLVYTQAPDFGNARVFIMGQPRGDLVLYAPTVRTSRMDLGEIELPAGTPECLLTVFGKSAESSGFAIGLDRLELVRK